MNIRNARFGGHQNFAAGTRTLTMDELRTAVPSAFAEGKHDSRSNRYTYIPTVNVIEGLMREGFQPTRAIQGTSRVEGKENFTKHMIRFRHADDRIQPANKEAAPEVVLLNSHDGTSAYKLMAGVFRFICTNGLVVADSMIGSLSIPHKGDIVTEVVQGSFDIIDNSRKALDVTTEWQALQLTSGEQQAYAEAAHVLRFGDAEGNVSTPIQPAQMLQTRRTEDNGNDLWRVFNRAQENGIRGGLHGFQRENGAVRRVTTRGINGVDGDVKFNRALWTLTERMAQLKGASAAA